MRRLSSAFLSTALLYFVTCEVSAQQEGVCTPNQGQEILKAMSTTGTKTYFFTDKFPPEVSNLKRVVILPSVNLPKCIHLSDPIKQSILTLCNTSNFPCIACDDTKSLTTCEPFPKPKS